MRILRRAVAVTAVALSVAFASGCAASPASESATPQSTVSPAPETTPSSTPSTPAEPAADAADGMLIGAPDQADYDLSTADGQRAFAAALKEWVETLTPEQRQRLGEAVVGEIDEDELRDAEWFNALDPGVQQACVQLPVATLGLVALAMPGTVDTPADSVDGIADSIAEIRDLQIDTDLSDVLDRIQERLHADANAPRPVNDPRLDAAVADMGDWIDANCTMSE